MFLSGGWLEGSGVFTVGRRGSGILRSVFEVPGRGWTLDVKFGHDLGLFFRGWLVIMAVPPARTLPGRSQNTQ